MKLHTIHTGNFKLDGGAMFGVVPKSLWNRLNPADENNMCSWAMRCLLIEDGDQKILIDNGMGDKQDEKFFSFYYLHGEQDLLTSLREAGFKPEDITDNLLSHLHFDHCGGGIIKSDEGELLPLFPNATFHMSDEQWETANNPNPREKASFLKENIHPMKDSGKFNLLTEDNQDQIFDKIRFKRVYGHTDGMLIPHIEYRGHTVVFMADLLPSTAHFKAPYVMGFDIRPLNTMNETQSFLKEAYENEYILFFEHDPKVECCKVELDKKGRFTAGEAFSISVI